MQGSLNVSVVNMRLLNPRLLNPSLLNSCFTAGELAPINSLSERAGRKCSIPKINSKTRQSVTTLRKQSFQVHGPQLFNCMPAFIRNKSKCSVQEFKEALDQYITQIPDQQKVGWLIPSACDMFNSSPSSSLVDQVREFQARRSRTLNVG